MIFSTLVVGLLALPHGAAAVMRELSNNKCPYELMKERFLMTIEMYGIPCSCTKDDFLQLGSLMQAILSDAARDFPVTYDDEGINVDVCKAPEVSLESLDDGHRDLGRYSTYYLGSGTCRRCNQDNGDRRLLIRGLKGHSDAVCDYVDEVKTVLGENDVMKDMIAAAKGKETETMSEACMEEIRLALLFARKIETLCESALAKDITIDSLVSLEEKAKREYEGFLQAADTAQDCYDREEEVDKPIVSDTEKDLDKMENIIDTTAVETTQEETIGKVDAMHMENEWEKVAVIFQRALLEHLLLRYRDQMAGDGCLDEIPMVIVNVVGIEEDAVECPADIIIGEHVNAGEELARIAEGN